MSLTSAKQPHEVAPRIIWAEQLVGSKMACARYGIDRSTLVRRIQRGEIIPLAQLDGEHGAYVFDLSDLPAAVE